jgi:hypothetical protein
LAFGPDKHLGEKIMICKKNASASIKSAFARVRGDAEVSKFRGKMARELRCIADGLERDERYVAVALVYCDQEGNGGPVVLVDSDCATVELADEMCDAIKNAIFDALE